MIEEYKKQEKALGQQINRAVQSRLVGGEISGAKPRTTLHNRKHRRVATSDLINN